MTYDMVVVRTAYTTARSMGASDKVMLALFEAAIVESGFRNLSYGDRDSIGFLQQRPSQGWTNPMDVPTATRSFVSRATSIQDRYATAGQLAQAVQRSAFPLRYDAVRAQASTLLSQMDSTTGTVGFEQTGVVGVAGNLDKVLSTLTNPGTWKRVAFFFAGLFLIMFALMKMTGDNKLSQTTKSAIRLATQGVVK